MIDNYHLIKKKCEILNSNPDILTDGDYASTELGHIVLRNVLLKTNNEEVNKILSELRTWYLNLI